MELHALQNLDNYRLYADAQAIGAKINQQLAGEIDYQQLSFLSKRFTATGKIRESLFCQKLQVKFLLQRYWNTHLIAEGVAILEDAHDVAVEILYCAESKRTIAPSFYKAILAVKIELANAKRLVGFLDEAIALEDCARRICNKAQKMFPTYQNFPTELLNK